MKSKSRRTTIAFALLTVALLATGAAVAQSPVSSPEVGAARIEWRPVIDESLELTVSGPAGFYLRQTFAPGDSVVFSAFNEDGSLRPAGTYAFELKANAVLDDQTRSERGEDGVLAKGASLPAPRMTSGYFSIVDGAFDMGGEKEAGTTAGGGNRLATKASVLTTADGVIRNSLCVGFDCPNSPTFSDSTILLMENNTRIKFGDTSNAPFPNNDWEIEANSNLSGGANYLGFNDCGTADNDGGCATDLVFAVEAGARQNALYVESDGDVGFGTSNPVVNLHAVDGNTPTLRLEQDGSSGFAPQTWDVAGNETNFFVRDVTNGSTLPFRIRPGAPSSSIYIDADGNVGIGTSSPDGDGLEIERGGSATQRILLRLKNNGAPQSEYENSSSGTTWRFGQNDAGSFVINDTADLGTAEFRVDTNGDVYVNGAMVHSSSRTLKENFTSLDPSQVLAKVTTLPVMTWNFKHDQADARHVGPTAEDFYSLFGFGTTDKYIADGDTAGIALLAIQGLNEKLQEKDQRIDELESRLAALEKLLKESSAAR